MSKKYLNIVSHYEKCFEKYGDCHLGLDWPNKNDVQIRYKVMLGIIKGHDITDIDLLDFGCGASHLYKYILTNNITGINYIGIDISKKFVEIAKKKFPKNKYHCLDIFEHVDKLPMVDYTVSNGVFTEKLNMTFDEMFDFVKHILIALFKISKIGLAFNVMSAHVDWERDDLFHLPMDKLAKFMTEKLSRNFVINNNYGLYEYTTYLYK